MVTKNMIDRQIYSKRDIINRIWLTQYNQENIVNTI